MDARKLSILLADDNPATRSALALALQSRLGLYASGEAANLDDLTALLEECRDSLVLLDWELPGLRPECGVSELRQRFPEARFVAMSARAEAGPQALLYGADAFISKTEPPDKVLALVRRYV
jgi:DNA-binding NarL/FixJ family response regulator